ncbi:TIR domain-containing protein [Nitrosomonas sp. Is24]|uniref:TIR domain-containing protein n=1 Tax=Nitrosomonas sp. Is24 TaxID=3080533 RepID=UPI00294B4565|nr:TIR domain-containing protein [Nitrosomonas sp. Is24]MDV6340249.1 TIR domain-containing protein [Nitrosomonas sp. Is24]
MTTKRFLVALSFPGEHRNFVSQVADVLAESLGKDKVFYDQWYTAELAQPDMDTLLQSFYHKHAELVVPFLCADYERKKWCGLEWRAIRDLIKQRQSKDIMPMRFDSAEITGFYSIDGYVDLNDLAPQRAAEMILERLRLNQVAIPKQPTKIYSNRLPTVEGEFFGRETELRLLDEAWKGDGTRIIQFIAPGGTGKTKLLRHWLDHTDNIDALIAWSFYSQGSSEDKQVSASPFFSHAFEMLGSTRSLSSFTTEEDKGDYLASLLRQQQRFVLVLDGLEPLQHAGKGMRNELKDRAMRRLLLSLAGRNNGLCIITTRVAVHELNNRTHVKVHDLQNLAVADGVKLLQSLGVQGNGKELEKAVREYGCHALALHLLGSALHTYLDDDVRKRDTLTELIGDYDDLERHAFKVMQAYSNWLDGTPELKLLLLLGLFDHPIETEVLQVLWQAQIPGLTANIDEKAWKVAIRDLREKHRLLSMHENRADLLDCHPLIREYFGKQLREGQPDAWRQAHSRLYEYYKVLPQKLFGKESPDTLEEMQPLFSAVAHGCAAGLHQQALNEVYWPCVRRESDAYIVKKLGAFGDDLATVVHFFTTPWHTPAVDMVDDEQAALLGWVGFDLCGLGRLSEALEPMQASINTRVQQKEWISATINAINLSNAQLALGNVLAALNTSRHSVDYADRSGDLFQRMGARIIRANALLQAWEIASAFELFKEGEQIQQERQPQYPRLYSLQGFHYCDFLLAQSETKDVIGRAQYALKLSKSADGKGGMSLQDIALDQLILGRAYGQQGDFLRATRWLDDAVDGLRSTGMQEFIPLGLLARAALYRDARNPNHDFARARQDLQEVYDIAEPSGMRLHLTDYHLEMARLLIAERESPPRVPLEKGEPEGISLQQHVAEAARLIEETGYKRRLPELQELQHKLSTISELP